MKIIGIDLAGVETNPTGFAIIGVYSLEARTCLLHSDDDIIEEILWIYPDIVSIDAPLSRPAKGYSRICEKQLQKMGIKVFPCLFAGMKKLTERGIRIAERLRKEGLVVIESYPGAAQDILGIPRKGRTLKALQNGLVRYGVTGDVIKETVSDHELDAITSALVGRLYLEGKTLSLGDVTEGLMVVPKLNSF